MSEGFDRLRAIDADIATYARIQAMLRRQRGRVVRELMAEHGWKAVANKLRLSRSRLYQMCEGSGNGR